MSISFNDLTTYRGIVQMYEKECGMERGTISGNTTRLKEFTADVNQAMDDFMSIAIRASGTWQFDDSNQTDYPIITTNLIAGQRDYAFTADQDGNLILDVFKVFVANANGVYTELIPVDVNTGNQTIVAQGAASGRLYPTGLDSFTNGLNAQGTPYRYDKLANAIFLDPIPSYNYANGLKVYINREASYFTYTDTTKKAGVPGILQSYFYKKPAYEYAARNGLEIAGGRLRNGSFTGLLMQVNDLESKIQAYFSARVKDEVPALVPARHSNK